MLFLILKIIGFVIGVVFLYIILSLLLPLIPIKAKETADPKIVEAYIMTNGVHTDLVLPVKSKYIDWSSKLPFENTKGQKTDFDYISFGWGDKGFYLDTPTWAELKFSTAFKAAFWLSDSAMHCTYYKQMKVGDKVYLFDKLSEVVSINHRVVDKNETLHSFVLNGTKVFYANDYAVESSV